MRLIIKSYLKTFTKNITALLGTLIFIIMLTAIVVGMLATPLQLHMKNNKYASQNIGFDYYRTKVTSYSDDFLYNYILQNDLKRFIKSPEGEKLNNELIDKNSETNLVNKLFPTSSNNLKGWQKNKGTDLDVIKSMGLNWLLAKPIFNETRELGPQQIIDNPNDPVFISQDFVPIVGNFKDMFSTPIFTSDFWVQFLIKKIEMINEINLLLAKSQVSLNLNNYQKNSEPIIAAFQKIKSNLVNYLYDIFISYGEWNAIIGNVGFSISDYDGQHSETKRWYDSRFNFAKEILQKWLDKEVDNKLLPILSNKPISSLNQSKILTELSRLLFQINNYLTKNKMITISEQELWSQPQTGMGIINIIKNKIYNLINKKFEQIIPKIENMVSDEAVVKKHIIYIIPASLIFEDFKSKLNNFDHFYDVYITNYLYEKFNKHVNKNQQFEYESEIAFTYFETKTGSIVPTMTLDLFSAETDEKTSFNKLILDYGRKPIKDDEIVISPAYAKANSLNLGDKIKIPAIPDWTKIPLQEEAWDKQNVNEMILTIVGVGIKYDNLAPGRGFKALIQDYKTYLIGYVPKTLLNKIQETRWYYANKIYSSRNYMYRIKSKTNPINIFYDQNHKNSIIDVSINPFLEWSDSPTAFSINISKIQIIIFALLGIVVLVLAFVFINFIIKKEINETRKQLGIFKAFGYKAIELSWIFAIKTLITIFSGIFIGYLFSIPLQQFMASNFAQSVTYTFSSIYLSPIFILSISVILPIVIMFAAYGLTIYYLTEPTLSLINNIGRIQKHIKYPNSLIIIFLAKFGKGFTYRLQKSFISRSKGKFIIVQSLFAFSALLYTLMFGADALIGQTINQGFAALKSSADHRFYWQNRSAYTYNDSNSNQGWEISDQEKYEKTKLNYSDYSEYGTVNKKLDEEWKNGNVSDSRYSSRLLLSYITNKYNNCFDKLAYIIPDQIINDVLQDTNIGGLKESNYFLNTILTIRIMNPEVTGIDKEGVKRVESFQYAINLLNSQSEEYNENDTDEIRIKKAVYAFENTINFYDDEYKNNPEHNPVRVYIGKKGEINNDEFIKSFKQTLFGLTGAKQVLVEGIKKELFNNIFLTDISRILSFELAQEFGTGLVRNFHNEHPEFDLNKIKEKLNENQILKAFNPEDSQYWKMINNPLVVNKQSEGKNIEISDISNNQDKPISGELSLSKLSKSAQSIIMSSMMVDIPKTLIEEPVITMNQVFYNQQQEVLMAKFDALIKQKPTDKKMDVQITAVDLADGYKYGDPRNVLNYDGVSNDAFKNMHIQNYEKSVPLNAIVPYALARTLNWNVGDVIDMTSNSASFTPYQIKIVGINKSMSFNLTGIWPIMIDYDNYAKATFTDNLYLKYKNEKNIQYNILFSNEPLLDGKINLKNIGNSISSMKFKGSSLTVAVQKESSIFASIFNSLLNLPSGLLDVDDQIQLITNPNLGVVSKNDGVEPYNITLATINDLTAKFSIIMLIFLFLQTLLLTIILIVVMSIVIDEAAKIILIMRALGYKTHEINWVVMGRYIIGAFILFIIAYGFSMLIWQIALMIVADKLQIYIFLPFDWKALVVTFLVLGFVILIGWYTAYKQVNRRKLPEVTNVG